MKTFTMNTCLLLIIMIDISLNVSYSREHFHFGFCENVNLVSLPMSLYFTTIIGTPYKNFLISFRVIIFC